jgi:acyl carrier protein phosphodiesterase
MNFLAHLFLAEPTDGSRIGGVLADFTVGRIEELARRYGPEIARGIQLHRELDRFTDTHPAVRHCVACLQPEQGVFAGIAVDVVFDYFLLKHWNRFTDETVEDFLDAAYASLRRMDGDFPDTYRAVIPRMIESNWLLSYRTLDGIHHALSRMSSRLSSRFPRGMNLHYAINSIRQYYTSLDRDFLTFFPEALDFARTAPHGKTTTPNAQQAITPDRC